ncbi:MAG: YceI family protein [Chitinophagaceae bacterium]|nr:YceI family protein [Chitinophagaceae bacterium]
MKRTIWVFVYLLSIAGIAQSQVYLDRAGFASFYASTPLEDIEAQNKQVFAVIDIGKNEFAFAALLKGFLFKKQLMQTHFNENYVESDQYPKATFSGTYTGEINSSSAGNVTVKGNFTLHGVTRVLEIPATLQLKNNRLTGNAKFKVKPEDYKIEIPSLVKNKIAPEVEVVVNINAELKK